jgi:hypothetical protein
MIVDGEVGVDFLRNQCINVSLGLEVAKIPGEDAFAGESQQAVTSNGQLKNGSDIETAEASSPLTLRRASFLSRNDQKTNFPVEKFQITTLFGSRSSPIWWRRAYRSVTVTRCTWGTMTLTCSSLLSRMDVYLGNGPISYTLHLLSH